MSGHPRPVTRRTIDRVGGSRRHQWRQLWKFCPRVSKDCDLRVWNGDNLQIERFLSVERNDLSVGQSDSEITIPVVRDRDDSELLRHVMKGARLRRVVTEKRVQ